MKPLIYLFFLFLLVYTVYAPQQYTQQYNHPLTRSIADDIYCMINGDCTLNNLVVLNLSVAGDVFNVSVINMNVTGMVHAYDYLRNGTALDDIYVNEDGDTMTGGLNITGTIPRIDFVETDEDGSAFNWRLSGKYFFLADTNNQSRWVLAPSGVTTFAAKDRSSSVQIRGGGLGTRSQFTLQSYNVSQYWNFMFRGDGYGKWENNSWIVEFYNGTHYNKPFLLRPYHADGYAFVIDSNGNVGIGNHSPQHKLSVRGEIYSNTSVGIKQPAAAANIALQVAIDNTYLEEGLFVGSTLPVYTAVGQGDIWASQQIEVGDDIYVGDDILNFGNIENYGGNIYTGRLNSFAGKYIDISTQDILFNALSLRPVSDASTDFGFTSKRWRKAYFSSIVKTTGNFEARNWTNVSITQDQISDLNISVNNTDIELNYLRMNNDLNFTTNSPDIDVGDGTNFFPTVTYDFNTLSSGSIDYDVNGATIYGMIVTPASSIHTATGSLTLNHGTGLTFSTTSLHTNTSMISGGGESEMRYWSVSSSAELDLSLIGDIYFGIKKPGFPSVSNRAFGMREKNNRLIIYNNESINITSFTQNKTVIFHGNVTVMGNLTVQKNLYVEGCIRYNGGSVGTCV